MRAPQRLDVRAFLHDELLESLPARYDRDQLLSASRATYVIHQDVEYRYSKPVRDLRQRLVLVPKRRHLDQHRVADWVNVLHADEAERRRRADRFQNSVVEVDVPKVEEHVVFRMRAVVERDLSRRPAARSTQPFRSSITTLTAADDALADAAEAFRRRDVITTIRAMSTGVRQAFQYEHDVTNVRTTAAEAWALGRGVCQDMAHVMLAMCGHLGIGARYVSGHMVGDGASHAWMEAFDPDLGQVIAIDPTHDRLTDLRYVTTATGRDYGDVAPTSGTYVSSGSRSTLQVRKTIRLAEAA